MNKRTSDDVYAKCKKAGIVVRVNGDRTKYINDVDKWGNQSADYLVYDENGKIRLVDGCENSVILKIVEEVQ